MLSQDYNLEDMCLQQNVTTLTNRAILQDKCAGRVISRSIDVNRSILRLNSFGFNRVYTDNPQTLNQLKTGNVPKSDRKQH